MKKYAPRPPRNHADLVYLINLKDIIGLGNIKHPDVHIIKSFE